MAIGFRYGGDTSRGGKGRVGEKRDTWRGGAAHGRQIAGRRRIQCRRRGGKCVGAGEERER